MFACLDIRSSIDLIIYKTYADLRAEAERTYLGVAWWVLEPLIDMAIYFIVFGVILRRGTDDFVPFLIIGVTAWQWFMSTVAITQTSILESVWLFRSVNVSKIVFPITKLLINTFKFLVSLIVMFAVIWLYGYKIQAQYWAFPVLVLVEFMVIAAVSLPLCSIVPFFPDFGNLVTHTLRLLLFVSGVFFPISELPHLAQKILFLNPAAWLLFAYREVLMYGRWPSIWPMCIITVFACIGIYAGMFLITKYNMEYAKRITK